MGEQYLKKRKKKHGRSKSHKRKFKKRSRRSRDERNSDKDEAINFISSLYTLLENYPEMVSDLCSMLNKMVSSDTTFNLSQMTDANAANALEDVFDSLKFYGVGKRDDWSWGWKSNSNSIEDEYFLLRVCKRI